MRTTVRYVQCGNGWIWVTKANLHNVKAYTTLGSKVLVQTKQLSEEAKITSLSNSKNENTLSFTSTPSQDNLRVTQKDTIGVQLMHNKSFPGSKTLTNIF
jgi:hypothetical protein